MGLDYDAIIKIYRDSINEAPADYDDPEWIEERKKIGAEVREIRARGEDFHIPGDSPAIDD